MEENAYEVSEHHLGYESVLAQRSIAYSLKRIADWLDQVKQDHDLATGEK